MNMNEQYLTAYIFHDKEAPRNLLVGNLKAAGISVKSFGSVPIAFERVALGMSGTDIAVVHKDFGGDEDDKRRSDELIHRIHHDDNRVRIIVVSGEYPFGDKHVKQMGADAYLSVLDISDPWLLQQVMKGRVTDLELQKRGNFLEQPPPPDLTSFALRGLRS